MKKIILVSLLLFKGCIAFGQQQDTSYNSVAASPMINRMVLAISQTNRTYEYINDDYWDSIENVKITDTIPCSMLVTDTGYAYYLKGYEVREETGFLNFHWLDEAAEPVMQHKEYLDADKQPLPKNLVVWMSK